MSTNHKSGYPAQDARVLQLVQQRGVLRPRDLTAQGLSPDRLRHLYARGQVERYGRGLYLPRNPDRSEQEMLTIAAARVPHAVICLLSALRFHTLTTQNPAELWIAIDHKARLPHVPELPLRVVRMSGTARTTGVDTHVIDGVSVQVYDDAKTVVDCFKYRNKIGVDVAVEALREYLRGPASDARGSHDKTRRSVDTLWRYAAICRVTNVMRPYLDALV
jgi:predicted transcriptional regulator of viral defense system